MEGLGVSEGHQLGTACSPTVQTSQDSLLRAVSARGHAPSSSGGGLWEQRQPLLFPSWYQPSISRLFPIFCLNFGESLWHLFLGERKPSSASPT